MRKKCRLLRDTGASRKTSAFQPLSLTAFTPGYIAVCVLLLIGFPVQNLGTRHLIPLEQMPLASGIMALGYVALLALLKLVDYIARALRR